MCVSVPVHVIRLILALSYNPRLLIILGRGYARKHSTKSQVKSFNLLLHRPCLNVANQTIHEDMTLLQCHKHVIHK